MVVIGKTPIKPVTPKAKASPTPHPVARPGAPSLERVDWPGAPAGADLLAVAVLASNKAIAVGVPGAAWIDSKSVSLAPFADGIADAVWAEDASFAVAVGYGGIAHVWNGKSWSEAPTGTDADLHAVWGWHGKTGSRVVYAGGSKGTILALADDGKTWSKMRAPESATISAFAGTAETVWALGQAASGEPADGVILKLDGDHWVDACRELACGGAIYSAWSPGPGDLWTGGAGGELVHYANGQPELLKSGTRGATTAIWGSGPADVFVAGEAGFLLWWNGRSWAPLAVGDDDLRGISGLPSGEAFVVGASGTIRHVVRAPN